MNTTCTRCGATLRPGRTPAQCEHCYPRIHPAATAGGEDSGLIDIRAMPGLLGAPVRPITPIPGLGGLARPDLSAAPRQAAHTPAPIVRPSQTPLHVLLGVLVFGVVGLAGAVVHSATRSPDPTVQFIDVPAQEPTPAAITDAPDEVATKPATSTISTISEPGPAAPDTAVVAAKAGPRKPTRPRTGPDQPEITNQVTKPVAKPEPVAAPQPDERESVACLLEGKCGSKPAPASPTSPTPAPTVGSDLPAKLEPADISDGTRAAKAAATSRCSPLAKGGETVKIKLSIAGPTGAVLNTSPELDGGNPSLASCCATELRAAQFRAVQKPQMGAVVTLKF